MISPVTVRLVCPHCSLGFTALVMGLQGKQQLACPACAARIDPRPVVAEMVIADRRLRPASIPRRRRPATPRPNNGAGQVTW